MAIDDSPEQKELVVKAKEWAGSAPAKLLCQELFVRLVELTQAVHYLGHMCGIDLSTFEPIGENEDDNAIGTEPGLQGQAGSSTEGPVQ